MTENIDMSVWINTRSEPLVTSARMAQGDMDIKIAEGRMMAANIIDNTIIANLIQRGFLGEEHRQCGLDLLDLRRSVYGALGAKTSSMAMMGGTSLSRSKADHVYAEIRRRLPKGAELIITHAMDAPCSTDAATYVIAGINVYQKTFEALLDITEKVLAEYKETLASA